LAVLLSSQHAAFAQTLTLKDGRKLEGKYAELASVAENPSAPQVQSGEVKITPLIVVDDGLRRTYFHSYWLKSPPEPPSAKDVRINIDQPVADRGGIIGRVGRATHIEPFDEYGRRTYQMQTADGVLSVVQGITQITPLYTKVEGLSGGPRPIVWDERIATSSIPRETLSRVLSKAIKPTDLEGRLQVVRLYLDSERYREAGAELEEIIKAFPERKDLQDRVGQLRQLGARLILKEIQLRAKAGQHQLARTLLSQFPSEGISGEILQQVRDLLDKYAAQDARRKALIDELNKQVAKIEDPNGRKLAETFAKEIADGVSEDAIGRLASFERLADDPNMSPDQKVALAVSGWLVGANQATDKFQTAISLVRARDTILEYLRDPLAQNRSKSAADLHDMEGASIERIAQILKLMKPPLDPTNPPKPGEEPQRLFELNVAGLAGKQDVRYFVQLPLEYDPLRHYPTIVTLPDAGVTPEQMLDFWAGQSPKDKPGERLGQATRHGYIVIAIDWLEPHQFTYNYTDREHAAVLRALRDACRRFSVDTDRVYLTGHGIGGEAAWDIAISHPDLWAGVLPIVALADKYINFYSANAKYLNWYFVAGELDGDKLVRNAKQLDRYMRPGIDVTVVEYEGRGFEPFSDEVQRMFEWMGLKQRKTPKEIDCSSMRPWDTFFWWLEVDGLLPKSIVMPGNWPPPKTARAAIIAGKKWETNKITTKGGAAHTTIWLSPEIIDFNQKLVVEVGGRTITSNNKMVRPDLNVLLEDVRTRADRQHPFWAKLSTP
jgi:pimeloyl-ACP methyl ester carboxylesterase